MLRRQAGAAVLDDQPGAGHGRFRAVGHRRRGGLGQRRGQHGHPHRRAGRAVAQRVVDQVAQQHRQQRGLAAHLQPARLLRRLELQILALLEGGGGDLDHLVAGQRHQVGAALAALRLGLQPRQRQQLLHQAGGAVAAGQRRLQRMAARGRIGHRQRGLRLRANAGDRGAQLMRGIGGEAPLRAQQRMGAIEQLVERLDQRQQLGRCVVDAHRRQLGRIARGQLAPEPVQRHQAQTHRPPHAQAQQRQRHQQRQQRAAQHRLENLLARVAQLADQHDRVGGLPRPGGIDPPVASRQMGGVKARHQRRQRFGRRIPGMHFQHAVAPDLEGHPRRVAVQIGGRRQRGLAAILELQRDQQRGRLRQMTVEQAVELAPGVDPGQHRRQHPQHRHPGQHPAEQPRAQRAAPRRTQRTHEAESGMLPVSAPSSAAASAGPLSGAGAGVEAAKA